MTPAIAQLDNEIRALQERLATEQATLAAHQRSLDAWRRALALDYERGNSAATIANSQRRIAEEEQAVADWTSKVSITTKQLQSKEQLRAAIEQAAVAAIAKGVDPAEAYTLAEAEVIAQKRWTTIIYVIIAITVVGVVAYGIVLWRRSRKK